MHVAKRRDTLNVDLFSQITHQLCHGLLFVITVAPKVVGNQEAAGVFRQLGNVERNNFLVQRRRGMLGHGRHASRHGHGQEEERNQVFLHNV